MTAFSLPEVIVLKNGMAIVITSQEFSGMVGESHFSHLVQPATICHKDGLKVGVPFSDNEGAYNFLKANYKNVEGRGERISYWHKMKDLSPEGLAAEADRSTAEAIARVI